MKIVTAVYMVATVIIPAKTNAFWSKYNADRERGSVTLEQAVIAAILFLAAVGFGAVIKGVIDANLAKLG